MEYPSLFEVFLRIWTNVIVDGEATREGVTTKDQLHRLCHLVEHFAEEECDWGGPSPRCSPKSNSRSSSSHHHLPPAPAKSALLREANNRVSNSSQGKLVEASQSNLGRPAGQQRCSTEAGTSPLIGKEMSSLHHSVVDEENEGDAQPQANDPQLLQPEDVVLLAEAVTRVGAVGVLTHVLRALQETCHPKGLTYDVASSGAPVMSSGRVKLYLMVALLWWAASYSGNVSLVLQRSKALLVQLLEEELHTAIRLRRLCSPTPASTLTLVGEKSFLSGGAAAPSTHAAEEEEVDKDMFSAVVFSLTLCLYSWSCNALFQASEAAQRCSSSISSSSGRSHSGHSSGSCASGRDAAGATSSTRSSSTPGRTATNLSDVSSSTACSSSSSSSIELFLVVMADIADEHDRGWKKAQGKASGHTIEAPRGVTLFSDEVLEEYVSEEGGEGEESHQAGLGTTGSNEGRTTHTLYDIVKGRRRASFSHSAAVTQPLPHLEDDRDGGAPPPPPTLSTNSAAQQARPQQEQQPHKQEQQEIRSMPTTSTILTASSSSNWAIYPTPTPRDQSSSACKNPSAVFLHAEESEWAKSATATTTTTTASSSSKLLLPAKPPPLRTTNPSPVFLQSLDVNVASAPPSHPLPAKRQTLKKPLQPTCGPKTGKGGGIDSGENIPHPAFSASTTAATGPRNGWPSASSSSLRPPRPPLAPHGLSSSSPSENAVGLLRSPDEDADPCSVTSPNTIMSSRSSHFILPTRPRRCSLNSSEEVECSRKQCTPSIGGDSVSLNDSMSHSHLGYGLGSPVATSHQSEISRPPKQAGLFRLIQRRHHHHSHKPNQEEFFLPSTLSSIE